MKETKLRSKNGMFYIEFYSGGKRKRMSLKTRDFSESVKNYNTFCVAHEKSLIPEAGKIIKIHMGVKNFSEMLNTKSEIKKVA